MEEHALGFGSVDLRGEALRNMVRDVRDYPSAGVLYKDITPLLGNAQAFSNAIECLAAPFRDDQIEKVIGIEARGFIAAAPVALALGAGFIPVRKPGKLPWQLEAQNYELEYGVNSLEIHADAIQPGERVLIIDDVLATGGTAEAAITLAERIGGKVIGVSVLIELEFLRGRERLAGRTVSSVLTY